MLTFLKQGTTSGFGRRLVKSALLRGDRVIATGRSSEKLQNLVTSCDLKFRANLRPLQLDVTEGITSLKAKADEAATIWGQIDVLVNNAGEIFKLHVCFSSLHARSVRHWHSEFLGRGRVWYITPE